MGLLGVRMFMHPPRPFWPALMLGGLGSAAVALVLGYPFLKVRGIYFSILTLLTAETFRLIAYYWRSLTGGSNSLMGVPPPEPMTLPLLGTVTFDTSISYYYLAVAVILLCLLILYLVEHSHIGQAWRSIKDSDELSQSVGINVIGYKIINFVVACFFAGISGALFAHYQLNLSPAVTSRFGVFTSIYLVVYLVVGGINSFVGPIVGTIVLTLISELTRPMKEYQPMLIGVIAILVVLYMPGALTGLPRQIRDWAHSGKTKTEKTRPIEVRRQDSSPPKGDETN
jgi:branched-chain amino acid transport system permease protein